MNEFIYENQVVIGFVLFGILFNVLSVIVYVVMLSNKYGLDKVIAEANLLKRRNNRNKLRLLVPFFQGTRLIRAFVIINRDVSLTESITYIIDNTYDRK